MEPPNEPGAAGDAVDGSTESGQSKKKGALVPLILFVVALLGGGGGAFFMYEKLAAAATGKRAPAQRIFTSAILNRL